MQLLLEYGADQNVQDKLGVKPMHIAAFSGRLKTLELLLESSNTDTYFSNPIKQRNKLEVVRVLLRENINPQIEAAGIHFAIKSHELEILELLLKRGADLNMEYIGKTPISYAIQIRSFPAIKLLVKYGVNLDSQIKTWIKKYVK